MAIGDQATGVGWDLVPESGEAGRIRWGAREINRTRDMAAQAYNLVPNSKTNFQKASGIRWGNTSPIGLADYGGNGDIYFQTVPGGFRVWLHYDGSWKSSGTI